MGLLEDARNIQRKDPGSPQRLVTVRGMGYRWNGDV